MDQVNIVVVFIEGLLSFLSPCVVPLLPVYMAILSRSGAEEGKKKILIRNTILFVLGISTTFFILGTGIGAFRTFLTDYKKWFLIISGILIMIMGLFYIGDLNIPFLQKERKFRYQAQTMNPVSAYLLGFTFSFGWTPCIGPMLASVLLMSSTSSSHLEGYLLIGGYTLGFVIPFLLLALFSSYMLKLLEQVKKYHLTIQKIGGYLLIATGFIMTINGVKERQIIRPEFNVTQNEQQEQKDDAAAEEDVVPEEVAPDAPNFTLTDQYGNTHTLSDYKGKVVFLNFWATWCPPCRSEMPDIETLYKKYGMNEEEVVVLGVASPLVGKEGTAEDIKQFLQDKGYTFPVVLDQEGELLYQYYIEAFPTTFFIDKEGKVAGYVPGAMNLETMERLLEQTTNIQD